MRTPLRGRFTATAAAVLSLALALTLGAQAGAASPDGANGARASAEEIPGTYEVRGISSATQRSVLAAHGVSIDAVDDHSVTVTADKATAKRLRSMGYLLEEIRQAVPDALPQDASGGDFSVTSTPSQYTSYAQMTATVNSLVSRYPNLMHRQVIGRSHQGRDIIAVRMSNNARVDQNRPEVLFSHNMHAREHLTTEMALYLMNEFATGYGQDSRITTMMNTREIWIIPSLNPDGKVWDQDSGSFRNWRKNRQPNSGSTAIGTDINRNFAYRWGCCGGSSTNPASDTYRGPSAESAPETRVLTNFVRSRVIGGRQQITAHIDFHTYSELILWPFGYTYNDTAPGLNQDQLNVFATVGRQMAASNGYRPQQSSDLYITDGSISDWMWGDQGIWSYTFEMYPRTASQGGFYPPGSVINRETARNREAVLILLENADCMYRSIGKPQLCTT
ncbi:M14 family metallopeptidase [Streptomyces calidiresistens]|uniref:Zinc carboxypeptidase n=1 Tax=Streptomyces calidiresistens TaxID=1485586 RepID=A0A7W3XYF9_9ACTN|nr:M14 family metallopeptidase [Streptomyces calidiresistens]MBB0231786.1 zinc carboxypeptidase [Streptomyces calidiresistens]